MKQYGNILAVIPARGGSVGVPRKNLRSLAGSPLISYSIRTALNSRYEIDVCVSSDDAEILQLSKQLGAIPLLRDATLADGKTTLDPVIYDAYRKICEAKGKDYQLIITMQPTSPLLQTSTIDDAIDYMLSHPEIDTLISARETTHLTWRYENGQYLPNYEKRVNRQELTPTYTETGGFLITRNTVISEHGRIGKSVSLYPLDKGEAIDIDSFEDFALAEFWSSRKKILFTVAGNREIGLSHARRALLLANKFTCSDITFLVTKDSQLAYDTIRENKYPVTWQQSDNLADDIIAHQPDIVINNILDTDIPFVRLLQQNGIKVINMEDNGAGKHFADLSINALAPSPSQGNEHNGISYYCLNDYFLHAQPWKGVQNQVQSILIYFGGQDRDNLTGRITRLLIPICKEQGIQLCVLPGIGYSDNDSLRALGDVTVYTTADLPRQMLTADIIITSPGRTALESASLGIPTIIIRHGMKDTTPALFTMANGYADAGNATITSDAQLLSLIESIINEPQTRVFMHHMMDSLDVKRGINKVIKLIQNIINS